MAGMSDVVVVERRYESWEGTAHGGYVAGLAAARVGPECEVTLRNAAPFDRALQVERGSDGQVELRDGDDVVVRGTPAEVHIDVPEPIPYEQAASHIWDHDKL